MTSERLQLIVCLFLIVICQVLIVMSMVLFMVSAGVLKDVFISGFMLIGLLVVFLLLVWFVLILCSIINEQETKIEVVDDES